jgi:hypothetical protein
MHISIFSEDIGGYTAMDTVQGRNSGLEFWIGVPEWMRMDIDYPWVETELDKNQKECKYRKDKTLT